MIGALSRDTIDGFNKLIWTCQSTLKSCFCDFPFSHSPFAHSLFKIYVRGAKNTQPSELLQKRRYMILIREKKEKVQSSSHSKCTTTTSCTGLKRYHPRKKGINSRQILPGKKMLNHTQFGFFLHQKCLKILIWCNELLDLNYIFASQYRNKDGYYHLRRKI